MTPGNYNLNLYRGDTAAWRFVLWQNTAQTIPVDLAGATVAAEIRDQTAGARMVTLEVAVTTPNKVDVEMTPAMYTTCPPAGVWDLQVTWPAGDIQTVLAGSVVVTGDVTDS